MKVSVLTKKKKSLNLNFVTQANNPLLLKKTQKIIKVFFFFYHFLWSK